MHRHIFYENVRRIKKKNGYNFGGQWSRAVIKRLKWLLKMWQDVSGGQSVSFGSTEKTSKPLLLLLLSREAASNFLTALSLQRKSRSRQQSHQVMSGNIWAALRIALSMLDQPELFQAANIGDLDLLMRAFNLDI